jgi:hypothetical protein
MPKEKPIEADIHITWPAISEKAPASRAVIKYYSGLSALFYELVIAIGAAGRNQLGEMVVHVLYRRSAWLIVWRRVGLSVPTVCLAHAASSQRNLAIIEPAALKCLLVQRT